MGGSGGIDPVKEIESDMHDLIKKHSKKSLKDAEVIMAMHMSLMCFFYANRGELSIQTIAKAIQMFSEESLKLVLINEKEESESATGSIPEGV